MIIASAQTSPIRENIEMNLQEHYELIELASKNHADLIVFPEMSITGYEREKAQELAFTTEDSRLKRLRKLSCDKQITVIAGAPIFIDNELYIGAFILSPDNSILIYTKQFLHSGEEMYFKSSSKYDPIIELKGERISCAICADISNPEHAENAKNKGATLYVSGIFFTPNGISNAYDVLSNYARIHSMNVLMSNYGGQSWGFESGGMSGFWNKQGVLIGKINNVSSGLLLIEKKNDQWVEK